MTADEEDKYVVAQANAPLDEEGRFTTPRVDVRDGKDILAVPTSEVDFMDVSPKQVVSVAAALIPFLENDTLNRALMGANSSAGGCASFAYRSTLCRHRDRI